MYSKEWWVKILPKFSRCIGLKLADMDEFLFIFKKTEKLFWAESGLLKIYRNNQIQLYLGDL